MVFGKKKLMKQKEMELRRASEEIHAQRMRLRAAQSRLQQEEKKVQHLKSVSENGSNDHDQSSTSTHRERERLQKEREVLELQKEAFRIQREKFLAQKREPKQSLHRENMGSDVDVEKGMLNSNDSMKRWKESMSDELKRLKAENAKLKAHNRALKSAGSDIVNAVENQMKDDVEENQLEHPVQKHQERHDASRMTGYLGKKSESISSKLMEAKETRRELQTLRMAFERQKEKISQEEESQKIRRKKDKKARKPIALLHKKSNDIILQLQTQLDVIQGNNQCDEDLYEEWRKKLGYARSILHAETYEDPAMHSAYIAALYKRNDRKLRAKMEALKGPHEIFFPPPALSCIMPPISQLFLHTDEDELEEEDYLEEEEEEEEQE